MVLTRNCNKQIKISNFEKKISMHTIKLRVSDTIYYKLITLLSKFKKEEIQIIDENDSFLSTKKYLENELNKINSNQTQYVTMEELDNVLEERISKYENKSNR